MNFLDVRTDYAFKKVFGSDTSKNELEAQHKRKEFISIQKLAILKADEEGFQKGLEKGLEQKSIEIAKNLLDILDNHTISLKAGLTLEVIEALRI